jgi:hypothetical protein
MKRTSSYEYFDVDGWLNLDDIDEPDLEHEEALHVEYDTSSSRVDLDLERGTTRVDLLFRST